MQNNKKQFLSVAEMALFAIFGTLMFATKIVMAALPNIHLIGMFVMVFTIVFRFKALIPLYIYVVLEGLFFGFTMWWIPYLYIWTVLWGVTMLLPRKMPKKVGVLVYPIICALHGLAFGILFAPCQALFFGLDFSATIAWIVAGLPFDITHGIGNFAAGFLILPLSTLLLKVVKKYGLNKRN